jgi:hypothetical protein
VPSWYTSCETNLQLLLERRLAITPQREIAVPDRQPTRRTTRSCEIPFSWQLGLAEPNYRTIAPLSIVGIIRAARFAA